MSSQGTSVFIFAHQDDEIGCFHEIEGKIYIGNQVLIFYLTSGSFSGKKNLIRNNESIKVLSKLGVQKKNIFFIGHLTNSPDGVLVDNIDTVFNIMLKILRKATIENLYFMAWEGGHQDHDAAHYIGVKLAIERNILDKAFQFPLYNGAGLPGILFKLFSPLALNGQPIVKKIPWRKRLHYISLCFLYKSQIKTWIGLFPFYAAHHIFHGTQILQKISMARVKEKPHFGYLLYERRGFCNYIEFKRKLRITVRT